MPSVQPVPSERIRVGKLSGMYTYMLHSHKMPPTPAMRYMVTMPGVLCIS